MPTPDHVRQKKCLKACKRCRSMKVKCSGSHPCVRCVRKRKNCQFAEDEARVSVTERYLRELEEQIARDNTSAAQPDPVDKILMQEGNDADLSSDAGAPPLLSEAQAQPQATESGSPMVAEQPAPHSSSRMSGGVQGEGSGCHSQAAPQQEITGDDGQQPGQADRRPQFSLNPLVDRDFQFAQTPDGRFWYMGPTSSWSFCRRVFALIGRRVPQASCPPDPWNLDGTAFKLQWKPVPADEAPDVSNLPPSDYFLFLFSTVKFYFGSLSYMIDEPTYLRELREFYRNPAAKAACSRAWYAQYLLILAFGKAFLVHRNSTGSPSGHQYASRAMAVLPDLSGMDSDPLACIQALTLAAVYFQAIDMRKAAYHHIGQALRTCIIEGMHRHVPDDLAGPAFSKRCRDIFWVVYMLDREFSALIGAPNSIRDEDITVRLPSEVGKSIEDINLALHVRVARLMARILTTVYGVGQQYEGTLIRNTQSILHTLAALSHDMNAFLDTHFDGAISRASRMAVILKLSHHRCVVLTIRPLVMCALHMHIEGAERQTCQTISLSPPVASLLQRCADSAQTILQIVRSLADDDLMGMDISVYKDFGFDLDELTFSLTEAFLPFQVEDVFSSAFVLYLIRAIAPSLVSNDLWCNNLNCVLEKLISRGNLAAPLRRLELRQLEHLLTPLIFNTERHAIPATNSGQGICNMDGAYALDNMGVEDEFGWDILALNSSATVQPRELLDLADMLDMDSIMHSTGT